MGRLIFTESKHKKILYIALIFGVGFLFYALPGLFKTLLSIFLPFAAAAIFAHILSPPSQYISEKLHIPCGISCTFTVISFFAVLFCAVYLIGSKLFSELSGFTLQLPNIAMSIPNTVESLKNGINELFPFIDINNGDIIKSSLSGLSGMLTEKITSAVSGVALFVPKLILSFFVTVVATCYFTKDLKRLKRFIMCQMPEKARIFIAECKKQLFDIGTKYIGAYFTIALITFAELFAGLTLIKKDYAFLLSLIITVVDILPLFGSGAILLPWALAEYLLDDPASGTKLLILYVAITVVRQIIEPKIVGDFIGLYPLTALFLVFAGGITAGFFGMFIFPICAIIIKNLNEKGLIKLYKLPPENEKEKVFSARAKYKKFRKS